MKVKFSGLWLLVITLVGVSSVTAAEKSASRSSKSTTASVSANLNAVSEVKSLLNPLNSLQGNFDQIVRSGGTDGKILQRLSGKVSLRKPAQFRWEVLGQEPRLVVADGKKVWDYDKELEQVTVQTLSQGQRRAPIFFLTGDSNSLERDFKIKAVDKKEGVCLSSSDACFELKPKKEEGSFQWIKIGFKDKILKEMEMLDQLGQHSQFIFKEVKLNETLFPSEFQFTPPKGVDVLKND